jgi:hypothetical protein
MVSAPITGIGLVWLLQGAHAQGTQAPATRGSYWPLFWATLILVSVTIAWSIIRGVIQIGSGGVVYANITPTPTRFDATATPGQEAEATSTPIRPYSIDLKVYATTGWQDAGLYVLDGENVSIEYLSGEWSVCCDTGNVFYVPPDHGEYNYFESDGAPYGGIVADADLSALIARIGESNPFSIGRQVFTTSSVSGQLYLRVNDHDGGLSDNAGSIDVHIVIYPR